jgi:uncharacterized short protein YbdD (DUF466 family)
MLNIAKISEDMPLLQGKVWPHVESFIALSEVYENFLSSSRERRLLTLRELNDDWEGKGKLLNECLGIIYAYIYGYTDSPCHLSVVEDFEANILSAKLDLERDLIQNWLPIESCRAISEQKDAARYLTDYSESNLGVTHPLFEYLAHKASKEAMIEFLRLEVCRNEVVDDEVALLVFGLQGAMKKVAVSNLWDECGNGNLSGFHTYWLRRLLEGLGDWDNYVSYRRQEKPWASMITSNSFNALLTRPGYKYRAYGSFLVTEGWVFPHFELILQGLNRVDLNSEEITIYFTAHHKLDPHHTKELITGLSEQVPRLNEREVQEVILGAHIASAAGIAQYDRILAHLQNKYSVQL